MQLLFHYDRQGNLVNEYHHDDVFGPTEARLRYVYDTAGEANFNSVYLGSALLMNQSSTFDQLGRVTQVSQSGGLVSSKRVALGYDSAGRLTQVNRYESGTTSRYVGKTDYTYDAIGRLSSIDHAKANGVVAASYDYTYDAANRLTQLQSLIDGVTTYAYDATGQVTSTNAVNAALDESFTYDATGNRVTGTVVGPDNELVSDATYTYLYDDEGRRTRRTSIANSTYEVYTWDHRGRLTEVQKFTASNQSQGRVAYKYDAFDRKIGRTEYSSTGSVVGHEAYIHQGDEVVAILDGNQKLRRAMLHGPEVDQVFAEETFTATGAQEEVYWGLADHQGTIRDVSTGYGGLVQVTNHSQYTTFGQSTHSTSPMRYTYTGRDTDAFTGLQYNRARWYDPATGRWISQDPIGFEARDPNLYRYVGNHPTYATDPSGLEEKYPDLPEIHPDGISGGTPKNPTGSGIAINLFGESENPKYTDYASDPRFASYQYNGPNTERPLTTSLKDKTVSDICIRNSPILSITWKEIVRVAMPYATVTITGPRETVLAIIRDLERGTILSEYTRRSFPQSCGYTHQRTGIVIPPSLGVISVTIQLSPSSQYIGPEHPDNPVSKPKQDSK